MFLGNRDIIDSIIATNSGVAFPEVESRQVIGNGLNCGSNGENVNPNSADITALKLGNSV